MDHASKIGEDRDGAADTVKKRYVGGPFGQAHLLENEPLRDGTPDLLCLHATAYSSQNFPPSLTAFAGRRHCIALDTPGYGASDPPPSRVDMAGYADAVADAVGRFAKQPVGILGYHTGAYIGAEACLRRADLFRRLIMGGRAQTQDFFRLFMMPAEGHIPAPGGVGKGAET